MRRSVTAVLGLALALAFLAVGTGLALMHGSADPALHGERWWQSLLAQPILAAHAVLGHVTMLVGLLVSSMAALLGLQGMLESGGRRRISSALLLASAPVLMGFALATDVSGFLSGRNRRLLEVATGDATTRFLESHAVALSTGLLVSLAATSLLIAWIVKPRHDEEDAAG